MSRTAPSGNALLNLDRFIELHGYINITNSDTFPSSDIVSDDFPQDLLDAWQTYHQARQQLNVALKRNGVEPL